MARQRRLHISMAYVEEKEEEGSDENMQNNKCSCKEKTQKINNYCNSLSRIRLTNKFTRTDSQHGSYQPEDKWSIAIDYWNRHCIGGRVETVDDTTCVGSQPTAHWSDSNVPFQYQLEEIDRILLWWSTSDSNQTLAHQFERQLNVGIGLFACNRSLVVVIVQNEKIIIQLWD